jgi:hypothetical protein
MTSDGGDGNVKHRLGQSSYPRKMMMMIEKKIVLSGQ